MFNFSGFGENACGVFILVLKTIEFERSFDQHVKFGTWEQTFLEARSISSMLIVESQGTCTIDYKFFNNYFLK